MPTYAWLVVVIFCLGVPGGCLALLWKASDKIKSEDEDSLDENLDADRFLYENYKRGYWYWEPLDMLKRIFMTGFLVVLDRDSYVQLVLCILVNIFALLAVSKSEPFLEGHNNKLMEAMLGQTIVTLLLCVLVKTGDGEGAVDAFMVMAQFFFVAVEGKIGFEKMASPQIGMGDVF